MSEVRVQLKDHGPILISGPIELIDGTGAVIDLQGKPAIALCRCAHTANSPFCDGTHKSCGFLAENRATPS